MRRHRSLAKPPCIRCGASIKRFRATRYCSKECARMPRVERLSIDERFWSNVVNRGSDGCWPWLKSTNSPGKKKCGYGQFAPVHGVKVKSHRYAYEAIKGAIPKDLQVHHACGNRTCCNPAHMVLMTREDHGRLSMSKHSIET